MMRKFVNLQTDLLRTFVTVVDMDSYTSAGKALGRTQPAISLQIKRLEELVGTKLVKHNGRKLELTDDGQSLIGYSRDILRVNDSAVAHLFRYNMSGILRIGLPVDYSMDFFQKAINKFTTEHPDVDLEVQCDWSPNLIERLHADELDVVIAMSDVMPSPYGSLYWSERPMWVCSSDFKIDTQESIPLVVHPEGCAYRARMIQSLESACLKWRISLCSPGISALQNAVLNGMGISALTNKTLLPGMRVLSESDGFTTLSKLKVGLYYKHSRLSDPALKLIDQLTDQINSIQAILPNEE
jgi:DNA-binding transcriptional LysR family regulator